MARIPEPVTRIQWPVGSYTTFRGSYEIARGSYTIARASYTISRWLVYNSPGLVYNSFRPPTLLFRALRDPALAGPRRQTGCEPIRCGSYTTARGSYMIHRGSYTRACSSYTIAHKLLFRALRDPALAGLCCQAGCEPIAERDARQVTGYAAQ